MRRPLTLALSICALCLLPVLVYESLQKTAESMGPRTALLRLSDAAERRVAWRPRTGCGALDHAEHELAETRLFWQLAAQQVWDRPSRPSDLESPTWSAFSFAVELADR